MNITIATEQLNKANELKKSGRDFEAASAYLAAQRFAMNCRSAKRDDIAFYAHTGAVMAAASVLENSTDHVERSEAGRIKAESNFIFRNQ